MANMFRVTKADRSRLRRLPFLPRLGLVVEFGGRRFSYKHASMIETLVNLKGRGFTLKNLLNVAREQLAEIAFPADRKTVPAIVKPLRPEATGPKSVKPAKAQPAAKAEANTSAPRAGATTKPVKKSAPKAAASKKAGKGDQTDKVGDASSAASTLEA